MPRDWWSSARTLTQAARLSQSWRSLKSVEIETLAGLWVSEVDVSTEMGAVGPQDDRVAILEIATKEAQPAEEVASKSTEERIDGQIMKIEEPPDPNVPLTVSAVVAAAVAAVVDDLKLEAEEVEDLMVDRAVKVVEELQGTVAATMGGNSFRLNS
jgi:hypothetical protein